MKLTSKYPATQKHLDIVLNLNRLTKRGRIEWERSSANTEADQAPSVPVYEADWKEHQVRILHGDPPLEKKKVRVDEEPDSYWIRVDDPNDSEIMIPPMPAVEDLVDSIERKAGVSLHEVNDPEMLDHFNRLLEEEL